jgi:hypothetical protein
MDGSSRSEIAHTPINLLPTRATVLYDYYLEEVLCEHASSIRPSISIAAVILGALNAIKFNKPKVADHKSFQSYSRLIVVKRSDFASYEWLT